MNGQETAETLALQAVSWLIGQSELIPRFFEATGATVDDLAGLVRDPVFLGAVLDFLLTEDALVMAFCDASGLAYDRPMRARAQLPGGPGPHWA